MIMQNQQLGGVLDLRTYFRFIGIDNAHQITNLTDRDFILQFQRAMLLSLKDTGWLDHMQLRQAESILFQKHIENLNSNTLYPGND